MAQFTLNQKEVWHASLLESNRKIFLSLGLHMTYQSKTLAIHLLLWIHDSILQMITWE